MARITALVPINAKVKTEFFSNEIFKDDVAGDAVLHAKMPKLCPCCAKFFSISGVNKKDLNGVEILSAEEVDEQF